MIFGLKGKKRFEYFLGFSGGFIFLRFIFLWGGGRNLECGIKFGCGRRLDSISLILNYTAAGILFSLCTHIELMGYNICL